MKQQHAYDYGTAFQRLANLNATLEEAGVTASSSGGASASPASSSSSSSTQAQAQLAGALRSWRANWGSVLALVTLYSIPTGAVAALLFAERAAQAEALQLADQERQLRLQLDSVRRARDDDLARLAAAREELARGGGGGGGPLALLAPARARLLHALRSGGSSSRSDGGGGSGASGVKGQPSAEPAGPKPGRGMFIV